MIQMWSLEVYSTHSKMQREKKANSKHKKVVKQKAAAEMNAVQKCGEATHMLYGVKLQSCRAGALCSLGLSPFHQK